jgi:hypothetical protein
MRGIVTFNSQRLAFDIDFKAFNPTVVYFPIRRAAVTGNHAPSLLVQMGEANALILASLRKPQRLTIWICIRRSEFVGLRLRPQILSRSSLESNPT